MSTDILFVDILDTQEHAGRGRDRGGMAYLRLLVVYDADATLVGEITYIVGHALGLRECAACDIT